MTLPDLNAPQREVRFAPINRHRQLGWARPKSAKSGLEHLAPLRPRFSPPQWLQTQI